MCLGGAKDEVVNEEFKEALIQKYPNRCKKYVIHGDILAPMAISHENGKAYIFLTPY